MQWGAMMLTLALTTFINPHCGLSHARYADDVPGGRITDADRNAAHSCHYVLRNGSLYDCPGGYDFFEKEKRENRKEKREKLKRKEKREKNGPLMSKKKREKRKERATAVKTEKRKERATEAEKRKEKRTGH